MAAGRCPTDTAAVVAGQVDLCLLLLPSTDHGYCDRGRKAPGVPLLGRVRLGVYSLDPDRFESTTGAPHGIRSAYLRWGDGAGEGRSITSRMVTHQIMGTTPMWHLTNESVSGATLSLRGIADGRGDDYLVPLSVQLNQANALAFIRPMAEMNAWWNPYTSYTEGGAARGPGYTTADFRDAWARIALILHGGSVAVINDDLAGRGLPPVATELASLPRSGLVATVWNPQGAGAPNVFGNQPADYYPGDRYVDWVANNLFSQNFHAYWAGMEPMYRFQPDKPFMVAEWGPWGTDDSEFVTAMFNWVDSHPRASALVYYEGSGSETSATTFDLNGKPEALAVYRGAVVAARYHNS